METKRDLLDDGLIADADATPAHVRRGDCVEVNLLIDPTSGCRERLWVAVESIDDARLNGLLLNGPIFMNGGSTDFIEDVPLGDVLSIMRLSESGRSSHPASTGDRVMNWRIHTRLVNMEGSVETRWFWRKLTREGFVESLGGFLSRVECEEDAARRGYFSAKKVGPKHR